MTDHRSKDLRASITVINLWTVYFDCAGCQVQVLNATSWPYYEEFHDPSKPLPSLAEPGYYVPVCDGCADRLADRFRLGAPPL